MHFEDTVLEFIVGNFPVILSGEELTDYLTEYCYFLSSNSVHAVYNKYATKELNTCRIPRQDTMHTCNFPVYIQLTFRIEGKQNNILLLWCRHFTELLL